MDREKKFKKYKMTRARLQNEINFVNLILNRPHFSLAYMVVCNKKFFCSRSMSALLVQHAKVRRESENTNRNREKTGITVTESDGNGE